MKIEDISKGLESIKKNAIEINVNALDLEGTLCKVSKIKYSLNK